ncbi:Fe-S cluster assembly protein SufD [Legionella israelensis]|uniref:ABC transporter permease n=1 Tax=Legionella israelensis TaxID=454 RepID=A0A0W0WN51_9GAMM|nr:Fe-S cluster assembly protein SufD [Legionella israelensis]KTD33765.1 ABC transporter permease [Legionella israelensis]QBS09258.1 Fe-S cluster assembly protein SufD [Legionella israelensis]SCY31599.1 Iron-regulated ABC transporter permease protein SufD [Legionella israelensis DSM 19235]STX59006.1 ABC transporter permease [Legionella israelensis]
MSELLRYYHEQARASLSSMPWLAELQQKALRDLSQQGFPKRSDEDWKYTRIEPLLEHKFIPGRAQKTVKPDYTTDAPVAHQVRIINGQVFDIEKVAGALPQGVILLSLSEALRQHADKIKPYLGQCFSHEHGFQALNTAMLQTGVFLYLPKGVQLEQPLLLTHWQDEKEQAVHVRHLLIAEENSQASILEEYRGAEQCMYLTNTLTEVMVHAHANISHYKIQRESRMAYHIGHVAVKQEQNSQFNSHSLSLGGKLVRSDVHIQLLQAQTSCLLNGIYAPGKQQHVDHHTTIEHLVPNCSSHQDYKGILAGHSRAVFNGKVIVAKGAQGTNARQQNKNLLLSEQAEIDTKPQLEIFADDVLCSHGATVGQLDEEALFYLATRGIEREEASAYLIQAFAAENIQLIPEPILAEWMSHLLNQQLGENNG